MALGLDNFFEWHELPVYFAALRRARRSAGPRGFGKIAKPEENGLFGYVSALQHLGCSV
jgi:hypothetical protein